MDQHLMDLEAQNFFALPVQAMSLQESTLQTDLPDRVASHYEGSQGCGCIVPAE